MYYPLPAPLLRITWHSHGCYTLPPHVPIVTLLPPLYYDATTLRYCDSPHRYPRYHLPHLHTYVRTRGLLRPTAPFLCYYPITHGYPHGLVTLVTLRLHCCGFSNGYYTDPPGGIHLTSLPAPTTYITPEIYDCYQLPLLTHNVRYCHCCCYLPPLRFIHPLFTAALTPTVSIRAR